MADGVPRLRPVDANLNAPVAGQMPKVTEIVRWSYQPGDRLIARVARATVTSEQAAEVAARIRAALQLPSSAPIAIATEEWTFEVVTEPDH